jgi:riboflavin synthase
MTTGYEMFTGIIEELGVLKNSSAIPGGQKITISANKVLADLEIDHSIAVDGVCLTVIRIDKNEFSVEAVGETLIKTTIGSLNAGALVNLERAMQLGGRLGGHLVQGHVNDMAPLTHLEKRGDNWYIEVKIANHLEPYVIHEGSIALNGISLTIAKLRGVHVGISVIPHTYNNTNIKNWKIGQSINIETDFLAKYIEKMIQPKKKPMDETWLKNMGY